MADFDGSTTRLSSPKSELAEVGKATQVLLDGRIRQLLVGTDQGRVYEWRLGAVEQAPAFVGHIAVSEVAVSALAYALGEVFAGSRRRGRPRQHLV